jgi:hypothetical protein
MAGDVVDDEWAQWLDPEPAAARIVERAGGEHRPKPPSAMSGIDLGVDERDLPRLKVVGEEADGLPVLLDLIAGLLRNVVNCRHGSHVQGIYPAHRVTHIKLTRGL